MVTTEGVILSFSFQLRALCRLVFSINTKTKNMFYLGETTTLLSASSGMKNINFDGIFPNPFRTHNHLCNFLHIRDT